MGKPVTIGIGSSHSGVGKTTLAVSILNHFSRPLFSGKGIEWGAIKYTKTNSLPLAVTNSEILMKTGKDTWQMLNAGAAKAVWVKSPPSKLYKVLLSALRKLSGLDSIIIEGNSAIEFLKPDIVIFILGDDKENWKPHTLKLIGIADIILYENRAVLPDEILSVPSFHKSLSDKNEKRKFFMSVKKLIDKKKQKQVMLKKEVQVKLPSSNSRKTVKAVDNPGIRMNACWPGCF